MYTKLNLLIEIYTKPDKPRILSSNDCEYIIMNKYTNGDFYCGPHNQLFEDAYLHTYDNGFVYITRSLYDNKNPYISKPELTYFCIEFFNYVDQINVPSFTEIQNSPAGYCRMRSFTSHHHHFSYLQSLYQKLNIKNVLIDTVKNKPYVINKNTLPHIKS